MMKQQILKICHDNAKMMKKLTEMKSLSSSSSTPPVNDILCKSTNIEILSAPSLPTADNENEKEKEEKEEHNEGEEDMYTPLLLLLPPPPPHLIVVSFCKLLFMAIAVLSERGQ